METRRPLQLAEGGTFYVGGERAYRSPNTTFRRDDGRYGPGDISIGHMYVEYQIPVERRYPHPLVLVHGGGHTGSFYRTTPDGREGWFASFARRGFAVYVVDLPNRGRAGWDSSQRIAVTTDRAEPAALEPVNVYSAQSAWTAFRWGPSYGVAYPDTQFPLEHLDDYLKQIQPAFRDAAQAALIHRALEALIDRLGTCVMLGWSTGTGNVMVAAGRRPEAVMGVVGLENFPGVAGNAPDPAAMAKVPFLGVLGDYCSPEAERRYVDELVALGGDATFLHLPAAGLRGNGHTLALEKNNEAIADLIEQWIGSRAAR